MHFAHFIAAALQVHGKVGFSEEKVGSYVSMDWSIGEERRGVNLGRDPISCAPFFGTVEWHRLEDHPYLRVAPWFLNDGTPAFAG